MAFTFTGLELLDMLVMTAAAGFIFMDAFKRPADDDPVKAFREQQSWWKRFSFSAALVAPAIIVHELGHKFVALAYGLSATFNAAYTWLGIGVLLKFFNFPFIFLVPAYVRVIGQATPIEHALISFAGPAVNLILWAVAFFYLKYGKPTAKSAVFWHYTKIINGFLFIFNMLPIPLFDGMSVYMNLWNAFV